MVLVNGEGLDWPLTKLRCLSYLFRRPSKRCYFQYYRPTMHLTWSDLTPSRKLPKLEYIHDFIVIRDCLVKGGLLCYSYKINKTFNFVLTLGCWTFLHIKSAIGASEQCLDAWFLVDWWVSFHQINSSEGNKFCLMKGINMTQYYPKWIICWCKAPVCFSNTSSWILQKPLHYNVFKHPTAILISFEYRPKNRKMEWSIYGNVYMM